MTAVTIATVAAGGAGAVLRYLVSVSFARAGAGAERGTVRSGAAAHHFPWPVLVVNVVGSAIAGAVLALGGTLPPDTQLVLLAGVCGGLTTFSTLSVETVQLVQAGRVGVAAGSVTANLVVGVGACALGFVAFGGAASL